MKQFIALVIFFVECSGHGRLWSPVDRSAAWRKGFPTPPNYSDNQLSCGGFGHQWSPSMQGKCGVCGDAYDKPQPRDNENGGKRGLGVLVEQYAVGQEIEITLWITAQHQGWNEFRLCGDVQPGTPVTEECLNATVLNMAGSSETRWYFPPSASTGMFSQRFSLPEGVSCQHCVLQWIWVTGNSWGTDPDGRSCIGCGPQEQFRGCSDIRIGDEFGTIPTNAPTTPAVGPTTTTTTPPPPTPSPWPTRITGITCKGIGIWDTPAMKAWCEANCGHYPPNCPASRCQCWIEQDRNK